jgi:trehalose-6-phosphate synthase
MPLEERRQRQAQNYRVLVENDITHWAERFLALLDPAGEKERPEPRVQGAGVH